MKINICENKLLYSICLKKIQVLTLCVRVLSADNIGKQFGPRSGTTNCRARSGYKLFDILMVFLKEQNVNFEKKTADDKKA